MLEYNYKLSSLITSVSSTRASCQVCYVQQNALLFPSMIQDIDIVFSQQKHMIMFRFRSVFCSTQIPLLDLSFPYSLMEGGGDGWREVWI